MLKELTEWISSSELEIKSQKDSKVGGGVEAGGGRSIAGKRERAKQN